MEQSLKYPVVPDTAMKSRRRYVRIVITYRIECGLGSARKERTYGAKAIAVCKIPEQSSGVSRINMDDKKVVLPLRVAVKGYSEIHFMDGLETGKTEE